MIEILDTTLRDGLQGFNINFSLQDRLAIMALLSKLNLTIEFANPSASDLDKKLVDSACDTGSLVLFGATRRKDILADHDNNLRYLATSPIGRVCIFGKASSYQVKNILATTESHNIDMITESIKYLVAAGKRVIFDAEHFFDGYATNPDYALSVVAAAARCGADTVVLCDTNGGSLPNNVLSATRAVCGAIGNAATVGIHCHNDGGLALACSLAAIEGGATHVQGTFLGYGERCGNTSIAELIATLELKYGVITPAHNALSLLTSTARKLAEITNISLPANMPYVGSAAFYHKAGMHIDAIIKEKSSFEHITPSVVGNHDNLLVSQLSGKNALQIKLREFLPQADINPSQLATILTALKRKEDDGYSYESAEASFVLFVSKLLGNHNDFFELMSYKVITDNNAKNSAIIKIVMHGEESLSCGEGVGPVHALDSALRGALLKFYPTINDISLTDYKVRVLDSNGATSAKVRVLITTTSTSGDSWATVGVSGDIIEASFIALTDSISYWLSR